VGAAIQSTLGVIQVLKGGAIGLNRLGERTAFFEFGDVVGAQGTMLHPYVLAGFAILAATVGVATLPDEGPHRRMWLIGIGVAAVPLGITFSRSGAVGALIVLGLLTYGAYRNRERYGAALIALGIGALIPALLFSGGWIARVDDSARDGLDQSSSGRITLIQQSFDLIESSPLVGVGPGRYAVVMEEDPTVLPQVVHNVPLLIAAESGVAMGLAALALLLLLGYRALRTSITAAVVAAGLGVWMVFDKFTYLSPNGLVMFAIWLGVLDWLWTHRESTEAT
jgi:O-antigen ligase